MTETPISTTPPSGLQELISRFWGFDKLLGSALVKIVYYVGLAGIGLAVLMGVLGALATMRYSAGAAVGALLLALLGGVAGAVLWRFFCELSILAFQTYNRLGEIRDRLPPKA